MTVEQAKKVALFFAMAGAVAYQYMEELWPTKIVVATRREVRSK